MRAKRAACAAPGAGAQGTVIGNNLQYSYKPSLVGMARQFELRDGGLWWQSGGKSGLWAYDRIAAIQLSYRPVSMQSRRFRADIVYADGGGVRLYSTTWQSVALMAPQNDSYRAFIEELHRRLAAANSNAVLLGGINPTIYLVCQCLAALVGIAMAGLIVRGVMIGQFAGLIFLAGFAAIFAWQIGGFLRRNKPRYYQPDDLPKELLP